MPMQETRCSAPGCGALIGGHNHKSSAGNTQVGGTFNIAPRQSASTRSFRGYRPEETEHYEVHSSIAHAFKTMDRLPG
jgi:hypothetical protein